MLTTSKNIQGNTELTLIAPLKRGLAPKGEALPSDLSYPARLSKLLNTLFGDRKRELEQDGIVEGLLEELQVIHSVQWLILGRGEPYQLMLAVTFDGPWEPYIRTIVDRAGPLLDIIFSHCEDYEGNSCHDGYQPFARWVRERQVPTQFLFGATPHLTTDDVRYLKQFEETFAKDPSRADLVEAASRTVLKPLRRARSPRWFTKVIGLWQLGALFPDEKARFDRVAALILQPEFVVMTEPAAGDVDATVAHQTFLQLSQAPTSAKPMQWLRDLAGAMEAPAAPGAPPVSERTKIQGSILSPYVFEDDKRGTTHGCFALLRFRDARAGAALLQRLLPTIAREPEAPGERLAGDTLLVNLGLTYGGLKTLGLGPEWLDRFPKEFQEGLEARAGMLGDVGRNHPLNWRLPEANWAAAHADERVALSTVDAVLILQAQDAEVSHELLPRFVEFLRHLGDLADVLHVQPTRRYHDMGHFGLKDGLSQPSARGDATARGKAPDQVALGELLLGYDNERGEGGNLAAEPLFKNSTFMAVRKMSQDVAAYQDFAQTFNHELALGRRASGVPLERESLPPEQRDKDLNDFSYPEDPKESRCPHFAHVRRSNPRSGVHTPRIVRRGMSYGPPFDRHGDAAHKAEPRGLMFTAIAASLAEQYEVVQRWVNAGNSTGVLSSHPDVLAGPFTPGSRQLYYSNAMGTGQIELPARQLSTLDWGLYTFLPSLSALEWLANGGFAQVAAQAFGAYLHPNDVGEPPNSLREKRTQAGAYPFEPDSPALQMKVFLEGTGPASPAAVAYWRRIQEEGGVRRTPFAVLVASQDAVQQALIDSDKFSVRSYWARMTECSAQSYLGMDPSPVALGDDKYTSQVKEGDHGRESATANAFVGAITYDMAFAPALEAGRRWLQEQVSLPGTPRALSFFTYARRIIRDVATTLFGLPADFLSDADNLTTAEGQVRCPFDLTTSFLHIFPPRPSKSVSDQAVQAGNAVAKTARDKFVSKDGKPTPLEQSKFIQELRKTKLPAESDEQRTERELRTLIGVLSGFAVPTFGHLVSVLTQLAASDRLWRLQRELASELARQGREVGGDLGVEHVQFLYEPLYAAMISGAVPERIHRTAVEDTELGGVQIKKGDLVALSIAAAADESARKGKAANKTDHDAWRLLFGALPSDQTVDRFPKLPVHACPAQSTAIGVLLGALVAFLEEPNLSKSGESFVVFAAPRPQAPMS